ncbi:hypothetical protein [Pontiella agarivorans]|uniref:Transcriptional regulator n=1 Tax=Pontiella agarivorans TaxID=3038953 RepID=A0ABU5N0T0_9BACT|nr:hypothetical protein [Pontiella agarivorans]MDZ8120052.1 hypothetical protein [Pontiella agarivorans]
MNVEPAIRPELDPDFVPAALWNRAYREKMVQSGKSMAVAVALIRPDETGSIYRTQILPPSDEYDPLTLRYMERLLKFLLWQRGACTVLIAGCRAVTEKLAFIYSPNGARAFDADFFGRRIFLQPLEIRPCSFDALPDLKEADVPVGRHFDGCRIGFDLGGSDRKCAAVNEGRVVFSEEVEWNPYFEKNPDYHIEGINDSLKRAAEHLPRVDAIGGSAAGVYVKNEVRVASLFRGVSDADFVSRVRPVFSDLKKRWNNVPFEVVNDGEVTALAGSMDLHENGVLGVAMGTSEAVGYVNPEGRVTAMLNELAFAPVDYRAAAPIDEWSGDSGCGVQYFSQQAVARLAQAANFEFAAEMPFPEQLIAVQKAMTKQDPRAAAIYRTMGTCLGYSIAHYADFYDIRMLMLMGRVMSGEGGALILKTARDVLDAEFPVLGKQIELCTPGEKQKRHGQAVAAASLPGLGGRR